MPVVNVHRYVIAGDQTGGTFVVTGPLDVTAGLVVEMRDPPFTAAGVWTIITFGSLVGTVGNITIDNQTGFTAGTPYLDGNAVKVVLSN